MKRLLLLPAPIAAIVLEALPWGVVMYFANPEGEPFRSTFSYFSLVPFGYAFFAPMIVAVLTCVLAVLSLVYVVKPRPGLQKASVLVVMIALLLSLSPAAYGLASMSGIAIAVFVLLLLQVFLLVFWKRIAAREED